jgi:hypothetical protein
MVFYIPFLESQIRIINSQFDLGLERISKVNLIILLIIPIWPQMIMKVEKDLY